MNIRHAALRRLVHIPGVRRLWRRFPVGGVSRRVSYDIWPRPYYAYGVYQAAQLARLLGLPRISVIEFGVAGGNGLLILEHLADEIGHHFGVEISVFGFDSGAGLPAPTDYRDLPYMWQRGDYPIDTAALNARLRHAELLLGPVSDTVPQFIARTDLPPVGFIAFDLDYYSSTTSAFQIFNGTSSTRLPRVHCYFDDINLPEFACTTEFTGELLAIREFNEASAMRKLSVVWLLRTQRECPATWNEKMYVMHDFAHPLYAANANPQGSDTQQLPLW